MNISKYYFLYNFIPSLKSIIENKKLLFKQKRCLKLIFKYYMKFPSEYYDKKKLRKKLKIKRNRISILKLREKSLNLNKMIIDSDEFKNSKSIFCYISFNKEIDTFEILKSCLKNNKILSVPVIKSKKMVPAVINNLDNLVQNKYGILEPKKYKVIDKKSIDLVVVPALGYNPLGYRLGYGKGYYDRFLKDYNGFSVGMVLKEFLITSIIPEKLDLPVKKLFIQ